jgi:UDP-N-acetylmuramate dehydrogenase
MGLQFQNQRRLSEFSTFGIGGPIAQFTEVTTSMEMEEALRWADRQKMPFLVLGKGSNCLFSDEGFSGLAILNKIDFSVWGENFVHAGSGHSFALLGVQSARKGFSGLEFASGIPATVGGAVFMNAGANGQETCQALSKVHYLYPDGTRKEFSREELAYAYRHSPFQSLQGVILSAEFQLQFSASARKKQLEIVDYRLKTQPYKEKSIGCIFRNPALNQPAGALIDACGLKGFKVGGAKVSEMHANFIVNAHGATAKDVVELIEAVRQKVFEKTGVHLEPEVRLIGF